MRKNLLLTIGEPAGIGPDIIVQCLQQHPTLFQKNKITIIGNRALLQDRAKKIALPFDDRAAQWIDVSLAAPVIPGKCDTRNAAFVMEMLSIATDHALQDNTTAIVTAPIQKNILNDAGFSIKGHTDFFSQKTNCKTVMMLMTQNLKVALFSDHLPLRDVPHYLTAENFSSCLKIIIRDFQKRFGIAHPKILVCGLNPHAGENGYLGMEEKNIMIPVMQQFQHSNATLIGPVGADVAFTPHYREKADVILAMYHDQGLPVIKYADFENAINVTLGLPFVRTSVDHGTALDIAGTGQSSCRSLYHAILAAEKL